MPRSNKEQRVLGRKVRIAKTRNLQRAPKENNEVNHQTKRTRFSQKIKGNNKQITTLRIQNL